MTFPTTPVLDSFTRTDETFPTAAWSGPDTLYGAYGGGSLGVRSFQLSAISGTGSFSGRFASAAFLTATSDGYDDEWWVELPGGHVQLVDVELTLMAGTGAACNGYAFKILSGGTWELVRYDSGVETVLTSGALPAANVYGVGIRRIGSMLEGWVRPGALSGTAWTRCGLRSDAEHYSTAWTRGIFSASGSSGTPVTGGLDNVGGGTPSLVPGFPASPVWDRFKRPDTTVLGDLWQDSDPYNSATPAMRITSQRLVPTSSTGAAGTETAAMPPCEFWCDWAEFSGEDLETALLNSRGSAYRGYAVSLGDAGVTMRIWLLNGGSDTALRIVEMPAQFDDGDWLGIRVDSGRVEGWWYDSSSGRRVLVAWAEDTTYDGPFYGATYVGGSNAPIERAGFGRVEPGKVHPTVLIDWGGSTDALLIGSGTIGDPLGGLAVLQPTFVHEYGDVTSYVQSIDIQRGRADAQTPSYNGRCELTLRDPDRRFVPNTVNGLGFSVEAVLGVRVLATYLGDDYNLFTGYLTSGRRVTLAGGPLDGGGVPQPEGRTIFSAADAAEYLNRAKVGLPNGSGTVTYTGQTAHGLVDLWLSQVQLPWRNVGTASDTTGLTWEGFEDAVGGGPASDAPTALALIQELIAADRGQFYVDAGGTAIYKRRTWRYVNGAVPAAAIIGTVTAVASGMEPTINADDLATRAIVTGTGTLFAGTEANARSSAATDRYGYRDISVSSQFIKDLTHASDLSYHVLDTNLGYGAPRRAELVTGRDHSMTSCCMRAELDHAVTVSIAHIPDADGDYWVDGIDHRWEPGQPLRTTLTLGFPFSSSNVPMTGVT